MVVNPEHHAVAEKLWRLPCGTIPDDVGMHAVAQSRALKDGCYRTMTANNMQAGPTINGEV